MGVGGVEWPPKSPGPLPGMGGPEGSGAGFKMEGPGPVDPNLTNSGALPESMSSATQWYLQNDAGKPSGADHVAHTSNTWGNVKYTFSQTPTDPKNRESQPPPGVQVPSGQTGFWLNIQTSGEEGSATGPQPWSQNNPKQFYIVQNSQSVYDQFTVYSSTGQSQPNLDTHYQLSIPNNMGKFQAEDPVGYAQFIQQMDKGIEKMTNSMLSQLKQQFKQEQQDDWGTING